jgi:D-ornithine 4,5-aminomutase subunit alpha
MESKKENNQERRKRINKLNDEELYNYFWELTDKIIDPIIKLSETSTSPSIERSVILRMGFSSIVATQIVDHALKKNLLGKGVGKLILKYSEIRQVDYLSAGLELSKGEGWKQLIDVYK